MLTRLFKALGRNAQSIQPSKSEESSQVPIIIDVTDADFAHLVEASEKPVVVDVWAEWCAPCQMISAYVGFLAKEYAGRILVTALDADENPQVCERYNVLGLPTLLFIKHGKEVDRIVGVVDYLEIKRSTEGLLGREQGAG